MTVSSTIDRSGPYSGNGVTVSFDYEFRILDETHITVVQADADGVETVLTLADYAVSGVGSDTGTITLDTPLPAGETLTIVRNAPFTQTVDLENQGAYYAETVERALDLGAMRDQQLSEGLSRALQIPISADPATLDGLVAAILAAPGLAEATIAAAAAASDDADAAAVSAASINLPAIAPGDAGKQLYVNVGATGYRLDVVSGDVLKASRNRFSGYVPVYDLDAAGAAGTTHAIQNLLDFGTVSVAVNKRLEAFRVVGTQTGDGVMRAYEFDLTATDTATGDAVRGVIGTITVGGAVSGKTIHGHAIASVNHTGVLAGIVGQVTPVAATSESYSFQGTLGTGATAGLSLNPINDNDISKFGLSLRQSLSARLKISDAFIAFCNYGGGGDFLRIRDAVGVDAYRVTPIGLTYGPLGLVGAPTYSFIGDTDTGMYSPSADQIGWAVGGVQRMLLDGIGNSLALNTTLSPSTDNTRSNGTAALRWANLFATQLRPGVGASGIIWTSGSGTPEGAVTAPVGSLFTRSDGGASTTLYVKQSGAGNTGWVAK